MLGLMLLIHHHQECKGSSPCNDSESKIQELRRRFGGVGTFSIECQTDRQRDSVVVNWAFSSWIAPVNYYALWFTIQRDLTNTQYPAVGSSLLAWSFRGVLPAVHRGLFINQARVSGVIGFQTPWGGYKQDIPDTVVGCNTSLTIP